MAKNFIYFAGSLPMLLFGEKPPVSVEVFDDDAARLTDERTAAMLKKVVLYNPQAEDLPSSVQKFYEWEGFLRNSWLDFRKKNRSDAGDYKRENNAFYSDVAPALAQAANCTDLMEAEKIIDRLRWNMLENLSTGHYFDLDFLALYRIKLQILTKYTVRTVEKGNQVLEDILRALNSESKTI
jgi:hypothetical protein